MEYLQRYSSFSVRNGTAEISLPFAKVSSFQSLISRKQLREIKLQMVSAISFGWFAEFGKTLPLFNARPNRFILTNGKHPMVRVFPKSANQPNEMALTICNSISRKTGHDFATSSDSKISGFTRPHVIGFVADLFFSSLESGYKNIRIRCRMRVDGSRIRKEKVADSKISGYVWKGLTQSCLINIHTFSCC